MNTILLTILSLLASLQLILTQIQESLLPEPMLGAVTEINTLAGMEVAQEAYFQTHGKYLQIIPDNRLPHYESGTIAGKLGKTVAPGWKVHVYVTPKGEHGWQAFWEDSNNYYSKGYGPEALSRTFTTPKWSSVSSTTALNLFNEFFKFSIWGWFINTALALTANTNSADFTAASTQYYSITDTAQTGLDLLNDLSFSFWVNFKDVTVITHGLISKRNATGNNRSYELLWDSSNILQFNSWSDGITSGCSFDNSWTPVINTWYNVALTKATATVRFWVDGVQITPTRNCTNENIFDGNATVTIGARTDATIPLDGLLDETKVWSRQLSSTEVSDNNTAPCTFDNGLSLQAQWLFDVGGDDETANNNALTNNNTVATSTNVAYTCVSAAAAPIVIPPIIFE